MIIRKAKKTDLQSWSKLRNELWPDQIETHAKELNDYFVGRSNDIVKVYVAEATNKEVIGFIELNLRNFAEGSSARFIPYIEGWFVDKNHRGQGVGKKLITKAEAWATECGFAELASDTEIDNKKSIAIHNKLGFEEVERIVCFIKKLKV